MDVRPADGDDLDRRLERLPFGRRSGLAHDVHPRDDLAERGEALPVLVPLPAEVELGLGADAEEEARRGRVPAERAIEIVPSSCLSPVTDVRSRAIGGKSRRAGHLAALDDLDLDRVVGLVVHGHGPVEDRAVVELGVHIPQEIGRRDRGLVGVDLDDDEAHLAPDEHARVLGRAGERRRMLRGPREEEPLSRFCAWLRGKAYSIFSGPSLQSFFALLPAGPINRPAAPRLRGTGRPSRRCRSGRSWPCRCPPAGRDGGRPPPSSDCRRRSRSRLRSKACASFPWR